MNEEPADSRDLTKLPEEELQHWLRCERHVKNKFLVNPTGPETKVAERARMASGRIKRIEEELQRRKK